MDDFSHYLKKHTQDITVVIIAAFLLLAAGEYYLYRQVTHLNRMVSEGLFQINTNFNNQKELNNKTTNTSPSPVKK